MAPEARPIEIACAVEGDYVPHAATMLHSALAHRGARPLRVHYLHGPEHAKGDLELVAGMVEEGGGEIRFVEVSDERCRGLPTRGFTGKATWYRIFLPELAPHASRILCIDLDAVVADSLELLWQTDLDGFYLAAVTNVFDPKFIDRPDELGIRHERYFNAGVMLLNLDEWRRQGASEALYAYGTEHADELVLRDQDALNMVLGERRRPLAPRWNCMNSMFLFGWAAYVFTQEELDEARERPAIRHFEGPDQNKPWHYLCDREMREIYAEHRRQTPWPRTRPAGRTPLNLVRRRIRLRRERRRQAAAAR
jgi:lipopolysaccharide biosynthesis glycosyltransferase